MKNICQQPRMTHIFERMINQIHINWNLLYLYQIDIFSFIVGEEAFSYGYGGTGKASTESNFNDYGETFSTGDVITAYLVRI